MIPEFLRRLGYYFRRRRFEDELDEEMRHHASLAGRARFYRLTPAGRKQLATELAGFERVMGAIGKVIQPA